MCRIGPCYAKSRLGWVITYANCPILWASKIQSQVVLSTTEAEYISLSSALQDVIPLMDMAKELWDKFDFDIFCSNIDVFCHAFEDDSGALEIAKLPKMHPRTKHINICYHHFRERVR